MQKPTGQSVPRHGRRRLSQAVVCSCLCWLSSYFSRRSLVLLDAV
jgi:hypothetical protein